MDISAAQHQLLHHLHYPHQEVEMMNSDSQSLESIIASSKAAAAASQEQGEEKKGRPIDKEAQKCPRCESTKTKFCYYNNYSLSQPRYFCKSCRRYWTKGGTLRNVPIGGACRKSSSSSLPKRPSSPSFSPSPFKRAHNNHDNVMLTPNPLFSHAGFLGLGFHGNSMGDGRVHMGFQEAVSGTTVNYGEVGSSAGVAAPVVAGGGGDLEPNSTIRGGWNGLFANSGWHAFLNSPSLLL